MKRIYIIFITILLIGNLKGETIELVTLQYPPYIYQHQNEVIGIAVDIVKEAFNRMDKSVNITILPWLRALNMIKEGEAYGIFTIYKTEEREIFADFSNEILIEQIISLFIKYNSGISFDGNLLSLKNYKIGTVRGVSYGSKFDQAIQSKALKNFDEAGTGEQNILKLEAGRVDIIVSNKYGALEIIKNLKLEQKIKELSPEIESLPSYIAFSKKRQLSKIRDELDAKLKEMKEDGTYDKIINSYFSDSM